MEKRHDALEKRQDTTYRRLDSGAGEFAEIKKAQETLRQQQAAHGQTVAEVREILADVRELVASFDNIKGTIRVMRIAGDVIRWGCTLAAAALGLWVAFRSLGGGL
ncbi:MAG TPA: hypothetical protein VLC08_12550 [Chitinolyticbacter sp.]|nr:hypothetical protein [Chitinolyticbacter sp.]